MDGHVPTQQNRVLRRSRPLGGRFALEHSPNGPNPQRKGRKQRLVRLLGLRHRPRLAILAPTAPLLPRQNFRLSRNANYFIHITLQQFAKLTSMQIAVDFLSSLRRAARVADILQNF